MRRFLTALAFGAAFVASQACYNASTPSTNPTFGDPPVTSGSTFIGPADPSQRLRVAFVLQANESDLQTYLRQVSDPTSSNYRRFLSASAIQNRFGPTTATQQQILSFMQGYGVTLTIDGAGLVAHGEVPVAVLSQIFTTSFGQYTRGGQTFVAPTSSPTLPGGLQGAVAHVLGLSTEPALDRASNSVVSQNGSPRSSGTRAGCPAAAKGLTLSQILTAYGLDTLQAAGLQGQGIYMAVMEESLFLQSNVNLFTTCFGITNAVTPQVVTIGTVPTSYGDEPHLDIEVILSVAPQLSGLYVFQSQLNSLADWPILYAAPLNTANTGGNQVTIVSSSLGICEVKWTQAAVNAMEKIMSRLAVAGISVFTSAGDSGSAGCHLMQLSTVYPASSQYVVAVGGTNLALNPNNTLAGSGVWNDMLWPPANQQSAGGGGGTSFLVLAPSWQTGTGISGAYRTTPDVALFADPSPGYAIYTTQQGDPSTNHWIADGGTSAAAPLMASGVALLQQEAAQNQTSLDLGYIWIYRLANSSGNYQSAFYDITLGNNDILNLGCCNAGVGYDLASGWGSVNFSVLASLLAGS